MGLVVYPSETISGDSQPSLDTPISETKNAPPGPTGGPERHRAGVTLTRDERPCSGPTTPEGRLVRSTERQGLPAQFPPVGPPRTSRLSPFGRRRSATTRSMHRARMSFSLKPINTPRSRRFALRARTGPYLCTVTTLSAATCACIRYAAESGTGEWIYLRNLTRGSASSMMWQSSGARAAWSGPGRLAD